MGDIYQLVQKGSTQETLSRAFEEVTAQPDLKGIVLLFGDDPTEFYVSYSEEVDPVSAYWVLSKAAEFQLCIEVEDE